MTRKHFAAIAAAMYGVRPATRVPLTQWTIDCEALATVFYGMNPRFDRARFLNACNGK
jgi:hypothetical protein